MKKILFSFFALTLIATTCYADCPKAQHSCQKDCEITSDNLKCDKIEQKCDKCSIEDDEYCVYNECYFDKRYRRLKLLTSPTRQQECNMDALYKRLKIDMENIHTRYRVQKNKVLSMIECDNKCYKEEAKELKEIKKECKERLKCFKKDVKEQLCKDQYKGYRKFNRQEKRRMKKIAKYGKIYKLPCTKCCK